MGCNQIEGSQQSWGLGTGEYDKYPTLWKDAPHVGPATHEVET